MDPSFRLGQIESSWGEKKNLNLQYFQSNKLDYELNKSKDEKTLKKKKEDEKHDYFHDYFRGLTKCNFVDFDSLRIANVDALAGLTKYSGGYLAQSANFELNGFGKMLHFVTIGNSGSFAEYFNWRRLDSYGVIFKSKTKVEEPIKYNVDYSRVTILHDFNRLLEYSEDVFSVYGGLDVVVCDTVKNIRNVSNSLVFNDLVLMIQGLILSKTILKKDKGIHVTFLKESKSDIAKQYIFLHALLFEEIAVFKNFTSNVHTDDVVIICKKIKKTDTKIDNKMKIFEKMDKRFLSYIRQINDEITEYQNKVKENIIKEFNYPRIVSSWGLTMDEIKNF
jgi:hypothetical protein